MKKPGELTHVEFRTECEPPTEPGWYWAVLKVDMPDDPSIYRVEEGYAESLYVLGLDIPSPAAIKDFFWYGPVVTVKRS